MFLVTGFDYLGNKKAMASIYVSHKFDFGWLMYNQKSKSL